MLNARWDADARLQLDNIVQYIRDKNLPAAERLEQSFQTSIERLCAMPMIGRPGRVAGSREWIVHPNYLIIYRVTEQTIDIIRVLHSRQQYP
jgi:toxin ParE1/3/4